MILVSFITSPLRHLVERVHSDYLKAENKGEFFSELHKSESWYYGKFREYQFETDFASISEAKSKEHQERKVQSIVSDEQMLVDMVRENLTQRSDDFREERDSIVLVEKLLKDKLERNGALQSSSSRNSLPIFWYSYK